MVKQAIESLYSGKCTVTVMQQIKNPVTKITESQPVEVIKDQPCRLSFKTASPIGEGVAGTMSQDIKIFIAPEIDISAGSRITVTQNGIETDYCRSGKPAHYQYHQEIPLALFKEWS